MAADMGIRVVGQECNGTRQNSCLVETAFTFLATVAAQSVQSLQADTMVRVVKHRHQIVHEFRRQEMIEEPAAVGANVGILVPQPFSYRRKGVEAAAQQCLIGGAGVMRKRQLADKTSVPIAHFLSLRALMG